MKRSRKTSKSQKVSTMKPLIPKKTHFSTNMNLYNATDAAKCKAFPHHFSRQRRQLVQRPAANINHLLGSDDRPLHRITHIQLQVIKKCKKHFCSKAGARQVLEGLHHTRTIQNRHQGQVHQSQSTIHWVMVKLRSWIVVCRHTYVSWLGTNPRLVQLAYLGRMLV